MSLPGRLLLGILLILCCPGQLFAWDWHTRVDITAKDQPLKNVCELLEKQYGIRFSYSKEIVDLSPKVTVNISHATLRSALDEILSPYDIRFTRIGEQIVLTMRKAFTISGYVQDAQSGEKIIGATIWSVSQQTGTLTNQFGFFSLTLPQKDTGRIYVSYIGYNTAAQRMSTSRPLIVKLTLKNSLKEVVITENAVGGRITEQAQMSRLSVSPSDVKAMPRLLGEADVMRTIAALPGVSGGIDGGGSLNVRGGSPDQNLILLDGTPIFNASHLFGIFSVFNPDIVKDAEFYKGAFPARYGGRLSSVVDIAMKDGDMEQYHGEASIGFIAAKAMLEGPMDKDKTSFVVSARRSYTDLLLHNLFVTDEDHQKTSASVYFYDANVKVNHIFSDKDRLYFSGYVGRDKLGLNRSASDTSYQETNNSKFEYGNYAATLRWNHVYSPQLFSNATINYSQYYFSTDYTYNYKPSAPNEADYLYGRYYSRIENAIAKLDFEFKPNPKHNIRFGGAAITHIFNPGVSVFEDNSDTQTLLDTTYNDAASVGEELFVYAEDEWAVTDRLRLNAGLHLSGFAVGGHFYRSTQPRLGAHYLLPRHWVVKVSYTHMNQYLHLLTNDGSNLPNDLWLPSTRRVKPMFSRQASIGVVKTIKDNSYAFSLETYYKTMDNVIDYNEQGNLFDNAGKSWDETVAIGRGWSYGSELLLEKKKGNFKGWIGYTLAWAERRFPTINNGVAFPYKYDRRHDVELVLTERIGKRWELSANWEYTTGLPLTLPVASYEGTGGGSPYDNPPGSTPIVDHLGDRNAFRTRDMHRLDLSATHTKPKKWGSRSWTFSLYNAYNQQNPFYYTIVTDRTKQERYLAEVSILPILPSVSYAIKF
jgi:hypothetical protein